MPNSETQTSALKDADAFHKGDRIRKLRELAGYPEIQDFSAATGLDRGSLGRYEATGIIPRKSTLHTIALATKGRIEWIETGEGQMFRGDNDPEGVTRLYRDTPLSRQSQKAGATLLQFPARTEETAAAA